MTIDQLPSSGASSRSSASLLGGTLSWQLLDQVGCGICIVDDTLHLVYSNTRARQSSFSKWFSASGRLETGSGIVGAQRVHSAITGALFGRASLLQFFEAGSCVVFALSPIEMEHARRAVLITSERIHLQQSTTFQMYAKALRLTPKEVEVLVELARGREPKAVASEMHLSIETVRSHIKALLGKASAGSLRELLLRVATLPPIIDPEGDEAGGFRSVGGNAVNITSRQTARALSR